MKDIQSKEDNRIDIDKVGVSAITLPLIIYDKHKKVQNTVAKISLSVNLPEKFKGTHMSRFVEELNDIVNKKVSMDEFQSLLINVKKRLAAQSAYAEMEFSYFVEKEAPVSKKRSYLDYTCKFICTCNDGFEKTIVVKVPVTTLCPCSKAISKYGAHNQRSFVTVSVTSDKFIWIEDIIDLVEKKSSCEIYSLLKREDEKYVTEKAYDNPRFVEDMVREVSIELKKDNSIKRFSVFAEHLETIHNHNVFALIKFSNGVDPK